MPASADIYGMVGRGVRPVEDPQNALLKALQVQGAMQDRELGSMKMDEYRRGVERSNKLQQLLAGDYADDDARAGALVKGGFLDEGQKVLKNRADLNKQNTELDVKRLEMASKRLDIAGQAFGWVKDNPTPENAVLAIDHLGENGIWTPQQVAKAKADVMANPTPENVARLATMGYQSALSAKDQLPKIETQNLGANSRVSAISPVTLKQTTISEAPILQSADNAASNARQAADNEAARKQALQIAGMNDARAREGLRLQRDRLEFDKTKGPEDKPLNDAQSKALLFGSRMKSAGEVLDSLEKSGTTTSIPGSRMGYGVGSAINVMSSAQQQQLDQAKRDFINAVLRRESGAVIAESEFSNAEKQYFPQIGDSKEVIAQKRRNRMLATEGILREVPEKQRNSLNPQPAMPSAEDIRKQADNILRGG